MDQDPEKLECVYSTWTLREYKINRWFYNDIGSTEFKEIVFSSKHSELVAVYDCVFEEYQAGSGEWPYPSIRKLNSCKEVSEPPKKKKKKKNLIKKIFKVRKA